MAHIFGKTPVAYGQPGAAWAPQVFPALRGWVTAVYLGEGRQIGLRGRPFWYGGLLNIFNLRDGEMLRPNDTWSKFGRSQGALSGYLRRHDVAKIRGRDQPAFFAQRICRTRRPGTR